VARRGGTERAFTRPLEQQRRSVPHASAAALSLFSFWGEVRKSGIRGWPAFLPVSIMRAITTIETHSTAWYYVRAEIRAVSRLSAEAPWPTSFHDGPAPEQSMRYSLHIPPS